jgi:hypothetical protein
MGVGRSAAEPIVAPPQGFLDRWGAVMSPSQRRLVASSMARDPWVLRFAPPVLLVAGLVSWAFSLQGIEPRDANDLGLVTALPLSWWAGVGLVALAFVVEASNVRVRTLIVASAVVALVVALHGTHSFVEEQARFPTGWLHAGYANHFAETGKTIQFFDARMSWPGFFSGAGMAAEAMGVDARWFLRLAPVVANLAYLVPLKALANGQLSSERARWTALWIFVAANWVGQDYFSPQALNLFLMLTAFAIVTRVFGVGVATSDLRRARSRTLARRLVSLGGRVLLAPRWARSAEAPPATTSERDRLLWLAMLSVTFTAMVVSHQLTPVVVAGSLTLLVLLDRVTLRYFPLLCFALIATWLSWGAYDFWQSHLDDLFGGIGRLGRSVDDNVGARISGSADRLLVLRARVLVGLVVWVASIAGFAWRWRRGYQHLAMVGMLAAPFGVLLAQSYGGEAVLRVYLYALAPAAILLAAAITERTAVISRRTVFAGLAVLSAMLLGTFPVTRWGNEKFEQVTSGEIAAMDWVYASVPQRATLLSANEEVSWSYDHLGDYAYEIPDEPLETRSDVDRAFGEEPGESYLVLTRSQEAYGQVHRGLPDGWLDHLVDDLASSGRYQVVYRNGDAAVLCRPSSGCSAGQAVDEPGEGAAR